MRLHPVYGHGLLLDRLAGGIASGRFPQAALFIGAPGVGKQRLALWVAEALLCETPDAGHPCGRCSSCLRVEALSHPDVHWFVPIPRPKAQDPAKQVEEAEAILAEVLAARREAPLYSRPEGTASHSLASVRLLHRRVVLTPVMGRRKVVILGDAERLVVQDASPEAANAMLKMLEEPPANTTVLLTAADPQGLLPTIRSRLVPIRVGPVPEDEIRRFLVEVGGEAAEPGLDRRALLAAGSIGQAVWAGGDSDTADRAAGRLAVASAKGPAAWACEALAQPPWSARGDFTAMLDALAVRLRARLERPDPEADRAGLGRVAQALRRVESIRWDARGNANPQLALATLAQDLEALS